MTLCIFYELYVKRHAFVGSYGSSLFYHDSLFCHAW